MRVEHEYHRRGAWAYLAAWDVHRARLFGRCEARSGIAAFDHLVDQVMTHEPYRSARRVSWVMDNGSAHRGAKGDARLRGHWPTLAPVHTPCHASWLNCCGPSAGRLPARTCSGSSPNLRRLRTQYGRPHNA
jgi:hypothetical protein